MTHLLLGEALKLTISRKAVGQALSETARPLPFLRRAMINDRRTGFYEPSVFVEAQYIIELVGRLVGPDFFNAMLKLSVYLQHPQIWSYARIAVGVALLIV